MQAVHDIWFLGDVFLVDVASSLQALMQTSSRKSKNSDISLYIQEFFDVKTLFKGVASSKNALARIINALIEALNTKDVRLLRYLVVVLDKDIINEIYNFDDDSQKIISNITFWLSKQISVILKRKHVDLLDKKPGSANYHTTVIYVRMLCQIGSFFEQSRISRICGLRAKFNDALNDAVAKVEHRIKTINSCNNYEDFDKCGNLSARGKKSFWLEMDELLEKFDIDKIKLLPNPKNLPKWNSRKPSVAGSSYKGTRFIQHSHPHDGRHRKLLTPPPYRRY